MGRHVLIFTLLLGLGLSAASCANLSQPSPRIEFYTLEYEPPRIEGQASLAALIQVERFSAAPLYNTSQIIYRDRSFTRSAYGYHKWRSNPADLVTYFLARDLKESGLFRAVVPRDSGQIPTHVLEGTVEEFLELDGEDSWEALLTISLTLAAAKEPDISKRILFQKTYRVRTPCRHKNPMGLAEAMSRAMAVLSAGAIRDIHRALER